MTPASVEQGQREPMLEYSIEIHLYRILWYKMQIRNTYSNMHACTHAHTMQGAMLSMSCIRGHDNKKKNCEHCQVIFLDVDWLARCRDSFKLVWCMCGICVGNLYKMMSALASPKLLSLVIVFAEYGREVRIRFVKTYCHLPDRTHSQRCEG